MCFTPLFYDNNNISLRTHGPYHRHKSTKSGQLYISAHYRNGICTWPISGGPKLFILTTSVSSFARAQKMDDDTVAHHTTGASTCPALRRARHFPSTSYIFMLGVHTVSTYFYYTKAILMRRKLRNNSRTTTACGLHHTGVLNNWRKMKICKKHQIFEAIE